LPSEVLVAVKVKLASCGVPPNGCPDGGVPWNEKNTVPVSETVVVVVLPEVDSVIDQSCAPLVSTNCANVIGAPLDGAAPIIAMVPIRAKAWNDLNLWIMKPFIIYIALRVGCWYSPLIADPHQPKLTSAFRSVLRQIVGGHFQLGQIHALWSPSAISARLAALNGRWRLKVPPVSPMVLLKAAHIARDYVLFRSFGERSSSPVDRRIGKYGAILPPAKQDAD
jgi:hypothetical protein